MKLNETSIAGMINDDVWWF